MFVGHKVSAKVRIWIPKWWFGVSLEMSGAHLEPHGGLGNDLRPFPERALLLFYMYCPWFLYVDPPRVQKVHMHPKVYHHPLHFQFRLPVSVKAQAFILTSSRHVPITYLRRLIPHHGPNHQGAIQPVFPDVDCGR